MDWRIIVATFGLLAGGASPVWAQATTATQLPLVAPATPAAAPDSGRRLSLDDALRYAEQASEDIVIARAGVTRAEGQRYKARSQFLPQIYGSASYTRTLKSQFQAFSGESDSTSGPADCNQFVPDTTAPLSERVRLVERAIGCSNNGSNLFGSFSKVGFGAANQYNLGLSLTQNLFTGGRVTAQYRQAKAAEQSAQINYTSTHAQVVLNVVQAYYDAALSDRLVNIAEATLTQAETTLAQTRLARQVGNQPEFELLRAQVTRDNQVPVVLQRRADRDQAYLHLKQVLNLPLEQDLILTTDLGDTTTVPSTRLASLLEAVPDTNVDQRAPVRQARQDVVAQRNALTAAKSQRIPTFTLSSSYGRVAFPASGIPSWNSFLTNWTVTAGFQVPIFTGGNIRGDEMVADADLREAQARMQQTRELAELDTRNALAQLRTAEAQFAANAGTVDQAARAYQIAEVRYREGISTQTELNDSRIQYQQAQANRAQAARDLQVARIRVALLRDLPLSNAGTQVQQPAMQTTAPAIPQAQQQAPRSPQGTTPQAAGTVQASQVGVNP
jgi:outer membrane protein TolC